MLPFPRLPEGVLDWESLLRLPTAFLTEMFQ